MVVPEYLGIKNWVDELRLLNISKYWRVSNFEHLGRGTKYGVPVLDINMGAETILPLKDGEKYFHGFWKGERGKDFFGIWKERTSIFCDLKVDILRGGGQELF